MRPFKLEDLPPHVQAQARAMLSPPPVAEAPDPPPATKKAREPNGTEREYARGFLADQDARYEALTIRMANKHNYTPDWIVFRNGRPTEIHEVKGGYRMHSHQRARLAFDQARVEWPGLTFVWATKNKGQWDIKRYEPTAINE